MAHYNLSNEAVNDLKGIYIYSIRNFGFKQAKTYLTHLELFLIELTNRPELARDASYFAYHLKCYNYKSHIVFYKFTDTETILIIRVLGKHMDFIQHLKP